MHRCRYGRVKPMTNPEFWQIKMKSNQERDRKNRKALKTMGWDVLVVWECRTKNIKKLEDCLWNFLKPRVV